MDPPSTQSSSHEFDVSTGRGLGIISAYMFEPSRWYPSAPLLREQYLKFVNVILGRIRANESNAREARLFFELLRTDGEPGFWAPVPGFLPELEAGCIAASVANNEPYLLLLTMLRLETRERRREGRERSQSSGVAARTGLPRSQQEALAATIFGRETSSTNRSDAQNRFLKSWMETAYPEHVIARDEAIAARSGKDIQRDCLGLPMHVGTQASSEWPPGSRPASNRSSNIHTPEREPLSNPMTLPRRTPSGEKPSLRHHPYSGFAERLIASSKKRQPRLGDAFEPEAPRDPVVIRGFDTTNYAALQPEGQPIDERDICQQLKQMDLQSPQDLPSILQACACNAAKSPHKDEVDAVGSTPEKESGPRNEVSAPQENRDKDLTPISQPVNLSKSLPDPSSAEIDRAFLRDSSPSEEAFASQVDRPSFLVEPGQDNDSTDSTVEPPQSLLSQLLESAVPDVPGPAETESTPESNIERLGGMHSETRPEEPHRENSAPPPDLFGSSQTDTGRNSSPQLTDEGRRSSVVAMNMSWEVHPFERLP